MRLSAVRSTFGGGGGAAEPDDKLNIFSLASGHLYERLMRIMMLGVLRHTKTPVKFWFLKNYLSPTFTVSGPGRGTDWTAAREEEEAVTAQTLLYRASVVAVIRRGSGSYSHPNSRSKPSDAFSTCYCALVLFLGWLNEKHEPKVT